MENNISAPERVAEKYREESKTRVWWIKTALLLALVALSVVMLFTLGHYLSGEETPQLSLPELLRKVSYPHLALLLGVILLYIAVECGKYAWLLKVYTGKFRFRIAVKTMFLGKYYDGITPLSTGGQPFQIYYLHKKEIPSGAAAAIPIVRYLISIIFLSALSVVLLCITPQYVHQSSVNRTILIISWISLGLNLLFPVGIVLFSIFPKTGKKIILFVIALLAKLRIVKRKQRTAIKFVRMMSEYSDALKRVWHEFYKFIPLCILSIAESLLFVTIPLFVVVAVANVPFSKDLAIQIACLVIISRYTALLVPTPGNTGALEAAGSIVFITVSGIKSVIGWVVLVWRFLTYYVYILSGIGINIFEIVRGAVRNRKNARTPKDPQA